MSTQITREHTFDGIQEFDNHLPNWWLWSFYLACIFSVIYWVGYHSLGIGDSPMRAYNAEQAAAAAALEAKLAANPITDDALLQMAKEPAFVAEGARIFRDPNRCALCHKPDGGAYGGAGANLTDAWWIYGSRPTDIFTTIKNGRPPDPVAGRLGGMPEHGSFGLGFVMRATAFVLSIKGTNVQPGKDHEAYAKQEQ